jgi:hypothetical protein
VDELTSLIVYATPIGELAEACARYGAMASAVAPTLAQAYPPHCTLTGFFRRSRTEIDRIVGEVTATFGTDPVAADAVTIRGPVHHGRWLGFELTSRLLHDRTQGFARTHRLCAGDDAIRVKDWLHLSLAYGVDDLAPYVSAAEQVRWPAAAEAWDVGLWESRRGTWTRHG